MLRWAGILMLCAAISGYCLEAQGGQEMAKAPASGRPDLIKIDTLAAFGKLELPPVTFFHDKHTDALLKEKKSCDTCHFVENQKLNLAFKRKQSTKPGEIKDIYHATCIGCHVETNAAGKPTGPLDGFCRSCHDAAPEAAPARLDAGLGKVLHFRHVDAKSIPPAAGTDKDNCSACHHEYDKRAKKIFYARGKEESCRYCHLDRPKDNVKSFEQAAHLQCVQCHLELANKSVKENGPYLCAGCHGAAGQALTAKKNQEVVAKLPQQEVPRLMRGQPDAALVTYAPKAEDKKGVKPILMNPVPFDHKAHEKYNDSCRVCHHAAIDACDQCHTLAGAKEGKFVSFEQAMHSKSSQQSCIGCHQAKQADPNCAACHKHLEQTCRLDDAACRQCHVSLPEATWPGGASLRETLAKATGPQKAGIAEGLLKGRNLTPGTYAVQDIPEKVVIKELSDKYEPVEMSHRKHVLSLLKGLQDNKLAAYFHRDPGTLCQGCHHHSPPAKEPPRCLNCHSGENKQVRETNRPALLAALHGQCMSCHQDMGVKPAATACSECHEEKQK